MSAGQHRPNPCSTCTAAKSFDPVSDDTLKRSRSARVFDSLFQRLADRFAPDALSGSLTVHLPGGREIVFGHEASGPQAMLILKDYSVVMAGLKRGDNRPISPFCQKRRLGRRSIPPQGRVA